uniref:Uncharacterized protein n=1 Tax=Castor canadensis TaxID=51338 RepID=A0A8C0ZYL9_CASCN
MGPRARRWSAPARPGGGCRGNPYGTRRRPPERNFQSARLPLTSAMSSSPRLGTGRQVVGSWPSALPTHGWLSHSKLRSCRSMANPAGPQPTKRPTAPRGSGTATNPVRAAGACNFLCTQPSFVCWCRRPVPSSTTKRPPTASCATEHRPPSTSRRRNGSSPCVKRATRSSALFSCGPEWADPQLRGGGEGASN